MSVHSLVKARRRLARRARLVFPAGMKREVKVVLSVSIVAGVLLLVPVFVARVRAGREAALLNRKPGVATVKFRARIRGFSQIKVFFHVIEADTPGYSAPTTLKPDLVLRGEDAARLVRALHFEWGNGAGVWKVHSGPYASSSFGCTALEFCSPDARTLADLRVGIEYGGGLGARWYGPPQYIADSWLLPESRDYLTRRLHRDLTDMF